MSVKCSNGIWLALREQHPFPDHSVIPSVDILQKERKMIATGMDDYPRQMFGVFADPSCFRWLDPIPPADTNP